MQKKQITIECLDGDWSFEFDHITRFGAHIVDGQEAKEGYIALPFSRNSTASQVFPKIGEGGGFLVGVEYIAKPLTFCWNDALSENATKELAEIEAKLKLLASISDAAVIAKLKEHVSPSGDSLGVARNKFLSEVRAAKAAGKRYEFTEQRFVDLFLDIVGRKEHRPIGGFREDYRHAITGSFYLACPHYHKVPQCMEELVAFMNSEEAHQMNPIVGAIITLYMYFAIHPHPGANTRTSRIGREAFMLNSGLDLLGMVDIGETLAQSEMEGIYRELRSQSSGIVKPEAFAEYVEIMISRLLKSIDLTMSRARAYGWEFPASQLGETWSAEASAQGQLSVG